MESAVLLLMSTLLVIAAAAVLAPRLKIAAPLILVFAGIGVSLIPGTPSFVIDPHLVLLGLLPPLLYASATSIPVMNLRRELTGRRSGALRCLCWSRSSRDRSPRT